MSHYCNGTLLWHVTYFFFCLKGLFSFSSRDSVSILYRKNGINPYLLPLFHNKSQQLFIPLGTFFDRHHHITRRLFKSKYEEKQKQEYN